MGVAELFETIESFLDDVETGCVAQANRLVIAECCTWHCCNEIARKELLGEIHRIQSYLGRVDEKVEGAFRLDKVDILDPSEAAHHILTAHIVFLDHIANDALVTLQRGKAPILGKAGWIRGGVTLDF